MAFKVFLVNISAVIVFSYIYSVIIKNFKKADLKYKIFTGLIFGIIAILSMIFTFNTGSGVIFDGRSIILSLAGLLGGLLTATVAAVLAIIYRFIIGGGGELTGCLVIAFTAVFGVLVRYFSIKYYKKLNYLQVYLFGLTVHLITLSLFVTLPKEIYPVLLHVVWKPFLIIFPVVTVLLYYILQDREKRVTDIINREQSEKKYRSLFNNMNEGFVLFDMIVDDSGHPKDFTYIDVNPNYTRIVGLSKEELIGHSLLELFPGVKKEKADWIELLGMVVLKQKEITLEEYSVPLGKWLLIHAFYVEDSQFALVLSDISERKMSEIALQESEKQFHAFFDNSLDAMLITSPDGSVYSANPAACKLFERTESEIIELGRNGLVDANDPRLPSILNERFLNGKAQGELNLKRKDGSIFPGELSSALYTDIKGHTKTSMIIRDITERVNAKKILEEKEALLRFALEVNNDGIWDIDLPAKQVYISARGVEILELPAGNDRLDLNTWLGIVHTSDVQKFRNVLYANEKLISKSFSIEHRILTSKGKIKWVHTRGKIGAFDDYGKPLRITGTHTDITQRKNAEIKLSKSEELYRSTLDNMMEGCQIIGFDWRYIYINIVAEIHNRRPKEELLCKKITEVWPGIENTKVYELEKICMEKRIPQSFENEFVFPNGDSGWFSLRIQPVPEGIFILSIDISERKASEKALLTSESKYRALVEQSLAGIYIFERDRFLYANNRFCEIFGYTIEEILNNLKPTDVVVQDDRQLASENIRKRFSGEVESVNYIARGLRKDKKTLWIEIHGTHIKLDEKDVITGTILDITDRKIAEEKLQGINYNLELMVQERTTQLTEANIELEAFAYSVSHDLRAPLRAIEGFSRILKEDFSHQLDSEGIRMCSTIQENTQKMSRLINDLLEFSRVNRYQMQFSDIDMKGMADSVFQELTNPEQKEKIDFRCSNLHYASGDTVLIRQVWVNLISNAIKFSSKRTSPVIKISSVQENNFIVYSVSDNGAGFNPKYAHKLFSVFQRLHSEKDFEGTGVGLALVDRIIRRHGGLINAEGETDKGATIRFSLPVKPFSDIK